VSKESHACDHNCSTSTS